ncbi:MAG: hypothetical protein WAQ28_02560 [Bacteroidia bacterium]
MLKINTLKELKAEQVSLRVKKSRLENDIKLGFNELKAELTSFRSISKDAEELLASKDNHFLGFSLGTLADILTEKFLLKNSGLITKFILPIIVNKQLVGWWKVTKQKLWAG